jgi:hypothetical protein
VYPPPSGSPEAINRRAEEIVQQMLDDPGSQQVRADRGRYGTVLEVWALDGRGLRYIERQQAFTFVGFLEPAREERWTPT